MQGDTSLRTFVLCSLLFGNVVYLPFKSFVVFLRFICFLFETLCVFERQRETQDPETPSMSSVCKAYVWEEPK